MAADVLQGRDQRELAAGRPKLQPEVGDSKLCFEGHYKQFPKSLFDVEIYLMTCEIDVSFVRGSIQIAFPNFEIESESEHPNLNRCHPITISQGLA